MGVIMPRELSLAAAVRQRSEDFLLVLGLPLFFAATGIRMNLSLLGSTFPLLVLTILAAVAGKFGGTLIAARAVGLPMRQGVALGALAGEPEIRREVIRRGHRRAGDCLVGRH